MGNTSPSATAATRKAMAMPVLTHLCGRPKRRIMPRATASRMNSMEVVATAPLAVFRLRSALKPLKVPATTSAKAATTRMQNSQQNIRNSFLPSFPMYASMM